MLFSVPSNIAFRTTSNTANASIISSLPSLKPISSKAKKVTLNTEVMVASTPKSPIALKMLAAISSAL